MGKKRERKARRAREREYRRGYEAALSTPQHRHPMGMGQSHDAAADDAIRSVREWARYLDENHDLVIGLLSELVKGIVGRGIVTIPAPRNADGSINEQLGAVLMERRRTWERSVDVTGELSWGRLQRQVCRAWMRDGEEFIQHVMGPDAGYPFVGGETPYRLELLESEMVPEEFTNEDEGWRQGVRLNAWRMPLAYAVYRRHPGDKLVPGGFAGFAPAFDPELVKIVPAERVTHLKHVRRWPATRGISVLHGVIRRLHDLKDFEESERIKNRILASWTAAIEKTPELIGYEKNQPVGGLAQRYLAMAGGTVIDTLVPGEKIVGVGPDYPTASVPDYIADQVRRITAGAEARFSSVSRRYDGSYSAQRQELVETEGLYKLREDDFTQGFVRPVHERFVLADVTAGHVRLPRGMTLERASMAEYVGPATPWIDQLKEVQADALAVREGFATQTQIQIKRGAPAELVGQPAPAAAAPVELVPVPDAGQGEAA